MGGSGSGWVVRVDVEVFVKIQKKNYFGGGGSVGGVRLGGGGGQGGCERN